MRFAAVAALVAGLVCGLASFRGSRVTVAGHRAVHTTGGTDGGVQTTASSDLTSVSSSPPPSWAPTSSTTFHEATTTAATVTSATATSSTTLVPVATYAADIGVLAPRAVATPTRLIVPALSIDGPVLAMGVDANNELDVPPDARTLAWYRHGPSPGEPGSAVIAGHLDWRGVQGHFANLIEMPLGASIAVVYSDGSQHEFVVTEVELALKPEVVRSGVFDSAGEPVLRLVTCGGEFDRDVRSYRSNVIITAVPA